MNKGKKDQAVPLYRMPVEPDKELQVWEKWIQIRKEETTNLGKLVKKPPIDLTMNLLWKAREDKERRVALEHAQLEKRPTVRDSLWDQAPRLTQNCYCDPVYEIHRTPAEMGRPLVIEHVSVPKYIQEIEMGMAGKSERKPCYQLDSDYKKYRLKREVQLKDKLKKVDPYRPVASELIIRGSKPKPTPKKMPPPPIISITSPITQIEEDDSSIYALRINNTVFCKAIPGQILPHLRKLQDESWHKNCTTWTYYFNSPVNKACRGKLFLHNLGTVTLRYCWKKIKRPIPFIPEDIYEQVFFFNKNEDVLSPGQKKNLFFTFVSDNSGIYSEAWEFSLCNICFFDTLADKLSINLCADSFLDPERLKRKIDVLKTRINTKAVINMITSFINEAFDKAFAIEPQIYPYKKLFLEAEFFVMKNPVCFYHQSEVNKMKEFYKEMVKNETWNLSIGRWREVMMAKEFDDRMKYYQLLRQSHSELLKPWFEGDDLLKAKYLAVSRFLKQLANKFDDDYNRLVAKYLNASPATNVVSNSKTPSRMRQASLVATLDPVTKQEIHNLFYLHAYEHVVTTIELCAGVLSSLDLNRWIDFNFC